MINRAAVSLHYKEPALDWLNSVESDNNFTLEDLNQDRTIYLVQNEDGDPEVVHEWVELNFEKLFDFELRSWYESQHVWPAERELALFYDWFEVECNSVLVDTVGSPIVDET